MSLVRPFAALRPAPARAAEVAAPPYDVLSSDEARARAAGKPWSFLHVSKPEIDLAAGRRSVLGRRCTRRRAENLARMRDAGVLVRDAGAGVLRLSLHRRRSRADRRRGRRLDRGVRREPRPQARADTRPDKEDDRVRHMEALNAQTGPVLAAYPRGAARSTRCSRRSRAARRRSTSSPTAACATRSGRSATRRAIARDRRALRRDAGDLHRRRPSPLGRRLARGREPARGPGQTASHEWFLVVAFPHHELRILDYNRVVRDLGGMTPRRAAREAAARSST